MTRSLAIALVVRLLAVGLAMGLLYGLVLLERAVLAAVPASAALWWTEHPDVQPFVDLPIALSVIGGTLFLVHRVLSRLGIGTPAVRRAGR